MDLDGNLYIADAYNNRIRQVSAATGVITTVAGNGLGGYSGDGGPATSAELDIPQGSGGGCGGDLFYTSDMGNCASRGRGHKQSRLATTTALTSSANPATPASPVTFTATVTTAGSAMGWVTFYDGSAPLSAAGLKGSGVLRLTPPRVWR